MGLCEQDSKDLRLLIPTYLIALLPWSVLTLVDTITKRWNPFWFNFIATIMYVIVSILPYCVLIPYAILQGCSTEPDHKEVLTAVVAMFASLWNIRVATRSIIGLYDAHRIWRDVDFLRIGRDFRHLMPVPQDESSEPSRMNWLTTNLKCPIWHVLVSSRVVDNDWPGEAPRVPYVRTLGRTLRESISELISGSGKDTSTDKKNLRPGFLSRLYKNIWRDVNPSDDAARRCVVAIWTLWMVRRSIALTCWKRDLFWKFPWREESYQSSDCYDGEGRSSAKLDRRLRLITSKLYERVWRYPSVLMIEREKKREPVSPVEAAYDLLHLNLLRVIMTWERSDRRLLQKTEFVQSEMGKQLSNLPTRVKRDLSFPEPVWALELERYLLLDRLSISSPELKVCYAVDITRKYANVLSAWLNSADASDTASVRSHRKILAFVAILEVHNPSYPAYVNSCDSTRDFLRSTGKVIGAIYSLLENSMILKAHFENMKKDKIELLNKILGNSWNAEGNLEAWLHATSTGLESLWDLLRDSDTPTMKEDDVSDGVKYRLLPSCVYFSFDSQRREESRRTALFGEEEAVQFKNEENWVKKTGGSMSFTSAKDGEFGIYAEFEKVSKGTYAIVVSFELQDEWKQERKFPRTLKRIQLNVFVENQSNSESAFRKSFEVEPIFPFQEKYTTAGLWSSSGSNWRFLRCRNVFVDDDSSKVSIHLVCNSLFRNITLGEFGMSSMTDEDLRAKSKSRLRSARRRVVDADLHTSSQMISFSSEDKQ